MHVIKAETLFDFSRHLYYHWHQHNFSGFHSFEEHRHDGFAEIVFMQKGTLYHLIDNQKVEQKFGELLWIDNQQNHRLYGTNFSMVNVAFPSLLVDRYQSILFSDHSPLVSSSACWVGKPIPIPPQHWTITKELIALLETYQGREGSDLWLVTYLSYFFSLARSHDVHPYHSIQCPSWLIELLTRIESSPQVPSLREIFRMACRHPQYVAHAFKRYLGCSPSLYRRRLQIKRAAILLRQNTKATIQEIADQCGIHNLVYFHRLFKKEIGIPPHQYRQKLGTSIYLLFPKHEFPSF